MASKATASKGAASKGQLSQVTYGGSFPIIERGEVYWATLDPVEGHEQAGRRPVMVVSEMRFNMRSGTVIAMAMTTSQPRVPYPFTLAVQVQPCALSGSAKARALGDSWVKPPQIRVLSLGRLAGRLGCVSSQQVGLALAGLDKILGR